RGLSVRARGRQGRLEVGRGRIDDVALDAVVREPVMVELEVDVEMPDASGPRGVDRPTEERVSFLAEEAGAQAADFAAADLTRLLGLAPEPLALPRIGRQRQQPAGRTEGFPGDVAAESVELAQRVEQRRAFGRPPP